MNFYRRERRGEDLGIDIAPLIDVVFLLLIFFMVTTTFDHVSELRIVLPKASVSDTTKVAHALTLSIDRRGHYYLGGRELVNTQTITLYRALRAAIAAKGEGDKTPLIVRADAKAPYQSVVTAMDVATQLGLSRMSIATNKTAPAP
ncbi:ExbD/TolR family protein [Acidihalobacter ferrooxydans]|uniref:Biopolymer transporter ExbD n=1 Tax=Acidihalobacter ferrooxydans TaxID=1765967 RepID=A0A1P8UFM9_9GAMM|nr:biopolymer transporter ExbD [Acidihalobacter ferrooxydans]APZ42653.1 hypothetical protein BW247_05695 [Acidihalobacter ferrooxydans]